MTPKKVAPALKRALDILFSLTGLIAALLPMAAIALAVRIDSKGPALFAQWRPGLAGRPFKLVKFRTMSAAGAGELPGTSDETRLTGFGRWLRRWSLDELPELWNVLKGEMSLVGPRPLLMDYLALYTPTQARRHEVRPGITGLAQAKGRNAIGWEEKFALDVWYVDHWSWRLDMEILGETALRVLRREGISQAGHATMERFRGTAG